MHMPDSNTNEAAMKAVNSQNVLTGSMSIRVHMLWFTSCTQHYAECAFCTCAFAWGCQQLGTGLETCLS